MIEQHEPQEEKDMQARVDGFNAELKPLLAKYELGIAAIPVIHNGLIIANPTVVSARKKPELSKPE
jgi:hypothetical protein